MKIYSVWRDNEEQWDPDDIDEPVRYAEPTAAQAAECYANETDIGGAFIVRDDETQIYCRIEIRHAWIVTAERATSLAELCAP
jgi:hypothetical protein